MQSSTDQLRIALDTALPFSPDRVFASSNIAEDEMMLECWRTDEVFTHEQEYSYSHLIRQALFFKQGVLIDSIAVLSTAGGTRSDV